MKIGVVLRVLSFVSLVVSLFMLFPLALAAFDGTSDRNAFGISLFCGLLVSLLLSLGGKRQGQRDVLGIREGVGVVGLAWVIASAVGALPYWSSGVTPLYVDAFFETMSGFTTTGATILSDIEAAPRGILLWRALTHWMGGMGIIVLSLAILPFLGIGGMELYKAEVPGVTAEKLTPRLQQTAILLWGVYILMTLTETVFLMFGGMSLFDAFAHSCSTIATGGFSTKNASVGHFHSPYIEWVILVFMFLSGVNFSLYFLLFARRFRKFFRDEELRWYAFLTAAASLSITLSLLVGNLFTDLESTLRRSLFHVVSVMTTTGFITEDFDLWPEFSRFLFILLMAVGACGGSTGGGCKVVRFLLLGRQLRTETLRLLHPKAVVTVRLNGHPVPRETLDSAASFLMLYVLLLVAGTLFVTAFGHPKLDVLSSFTGVLTCLSNVGPGLNTLGAVENFAWLPAGVKWLFSFFMLAGRLELFAVLLLFLPGTWAR
ncbi:MAG: TrkH family potassium uptake protein [Synergistaceae bacterium]|nr:TrkH family potassium uptake protein [Synergistaceae bacterium]